MSKPTGKNWGKFYRRYRKFSDIVHLMAIKAQNYFLYCFASQLFLNVRFWKILFKEPLGIWKLSCFESWLERHFLNLVYVTVKLCPDVIPDIQTSCRNLLEIFRLWMSLEIHFSSSKFIHGKSFTIAFMQFSTSSKSCSKNLCLYHLAEIQWYNSYEVALQWTHVPITCWSKNIFRFLFKIQRSTCSITLLNVYECIQMHTIDIIIK